MHLCSSQQPVAPCRQADQAGVQSIAPACAPPHWLLQATSALEDPACAKCEEQAASAAHILAMAALKYQQLDNVTGGCAVCGGVWWCVWGGGQAATRAAAGG